LGDTPGLTKQRNQSAPLDKIDDRVEHLAKALEIGKVAAFTEHNET